MRIGLITAIRRSAAGFVRAELPLAGRSVLAWQVALMHSLGAERIVCLSATATGEVLHMQRNTEAGGASFHTLQGFSALPGLVRAEDDLIILSDGLVPDPSVIQAIFDGNGALRRVVTAIPAENPLATAYPEDFERIDAARHWAGLLVMRGAGVQPLEDFPADSDPVSLLLRLALQAGTPCHDLRARDLASERWLLVDSAAEAAHAGQAMVDAAAIQSDRSCPSSKLATLVVRGHAPGGLLQGANVSQATALTLLIAGVIAAALGLATTGLLLAATGAFCAVVAETYGTIAARLWRETVAVPRKAVLAWVVDGFAALATFFALAPLPLWQPLAALGPLVFGLARIASRKKDSALSVMASDRTGLLLVLAAAAATGFLPEICACLALGLLAALLLRADQL